MASQLVKQMERSHAMIPALSTEAGQAILPLNCWCPSTHPSRSPVQPDLPDNDDIDASDNTDAPISDEQCGYHSEIACTIDGEMQCNEGCRVDTNWPNRNGGFNCWCPSDSPFRERPATNDNDNDTDVPVISDPTDDDDDDFIDTTPDMTDTFSHNFPANTFIIFNNMTKSYMSVAHAGYVVTQENVAPDCRQANRKTNANGRFQIQNPNRNTSRKISFCLAGQVVLTKSIGEEAKLFWNNDNYKNIFRYVLSLDRDSNSANGIRLMQASNIKVKFAQAVDTYEKELAFALLKLKRRSARIMQPSMGMNAGTAQAQSSLVGIPPMFVDLYRTAYPFQEYMTDEMIADTDFDQYGWPTSFPNTSILYTEIIPSQKDPNAIPYGQYTVIYDGDGYLSYSHMGEEVSREPGKDLININPPSQAANKLSFRISYTNPADPIRNIRIIMPGGTCKTNPMLHVSSAIQCAAGEYQSFASRLAADRNTIIFNPDYLWFMKDFAVIRMMQLMETSHRLPPECTDSNGQIIEACMTQERSWADRPLLEDAVWGGSLKTHQEKIKGIPLEVAVELVNQLHASPWFSIPHNATQEFISKFAAYAKNNLHSDARVHLELGNEMWNLLFWGSKYAQFMGLKTGLDTNPYAAQYKYYINKSVELFDVWENTFGGTDRLYRIVETYQRSPSYSQNILNYYDANFSNKIDALAVAPYFYGCASRAGAWPCGEASRVPNTYYDLNTVDDVFTMLDNPQTPYAITQILGMLRQHAELTKTHNVDFITYEGGQSLAVNWGDRAMPSAQRYKAIWLFSQANRDPRMKDRYNRFVSEWREMGGELFMLYQAPQSFNNFGNHGLKENLSKTRSESPKFDAVMDMQEYAGACWFEDCDKN